MKSKGISFDELFDPDVVGDGPTAPGYTVNGVPLRYAHIKYGSKRADIGYAEQGVDLSNKWAAKGTASYNDSVVIPFGAGYNATSTDTHDAQASITFTINPDGTWSITLLALHESPGTSGEPLSGTWHKSPAAGVGSDYEMQATATFSIDNRYAGDSSANPSYTATTGWLPLSVAQQLMASTDHLLGGGAGSGEVIVTGSWAINIRKVGDAELKTSTLHTTLDAIV